MSAADFLYPAIWWTVLPLIDEWNWRRHKLSMWRGRARHFLGITAPVSVLFWLFFEALNLFAPQWVYKSGLEGLPLMTAFGFAAFATVIPIVVECWWLVSGAEPCTTTDLFERRKWACITAGAVFAVIPLFNQVFWFNQGMWLTPALVLLPALRPRRCSPGTRALAWLVASALLAGVGWEAFNWPARSHWEYTILPNVPHLFQMPLPGYLGFVPFAVSTLAVYQWQQRFRLRATLVVLLYAGAVAGLALLTQLYIQRGLWIAN